MSLKGKNTFVPDYLVTPGEVLEEYLESCSMTQAELAARTGLSKKTINEIVKGKSPITPETALKFERPLGRPADFWNNLERQYQEDKVRLEEKKRLEQSLAWIKKMPVAAMIKLGWIPKKATQIEQMEELLRFFGLASPEQWQTVWQEYQAAYQESKRFEGSAESVSAWLRKGEIEASQMTCAVFDKKAFQNALVDIREFTSEKLERFRLRLANICASTGVAVVFVPELPKTGIHGATRWFGEKAMIQLSLRFKSNDQFWFTFFHEAAHILLHGRKDVFLEEYDLNNKKENEADAFAANTLIPQEAWRTFLETWNQKPIKVTEFARNIGIAPGIAVGRLQQEKIVHLSWGNDLKVFY